MKSVKTTELDNGLRVVTDTMPDAQSVVVGAWVGVGTRHEAARANGVAHLVEHMMFKGTKRRSAFGLSAAIERKGGSMNAHTSREETAYYARVLPEDAAMATDVIADMLQHSKFDAKELDRERQVIIQEIGRDADTPEVKIEDLFYERAFPDQTLGRPILGDESTIARLPRGDVQGYVRKHYHAGNMVVAAAGRIEHDAFVALAKKHFGKLPHGKRAASIKARLGHGRFMTTEDSEQLHLMMGFAGPSFHKHETYATQVLSILLGGGSSSRLFQKVREKRGLAYAVHSAHAAFSDTGVFQIYAGTDPKRAAELMRVLEEELRDVQKNISASEVNRAKAQARADMLMGQESVMRRADALGHQMLAYNRTISRETILKKLMAVTVEDVENMARKIFRSPIVFTALGPVTEIEGYFRKAGSTGSPLRRHSK